MSAENEEKTLTNLSAALLEIDRKIESGTLTIEQKELSVKIKMKLFELLSLMQQFNKQQ